MIQHNLCCVWRTSSSKYIAISCSLFNLAGKYSDRQEKFICRATVVQHIEFNLCCIISTGDCEGNFNIKKVTNGQGHICFAYCYNYLRPSLCHDAATSWNRGMRINCFKADWLVRQCHYFSSPENFWIQWLTLITCLNQKLFVLSHWFLLPMHNVVVDV